MDDFNAKCNYEKDPDFYNRFWSVGWYLEGMGVLVKRGLISPELVDDLVSGNIIDYWERFGHMFEEVRRRNNFPQAAEHTEYLYNVIKEIAVREHPELKTVRTIVGTDTQ